MINQRHGERSFTFSFHSKINLSKMKKRWKINVQSLRGMTKNFVKFISAENFQQKEVIWKHEISQNQ